MNIIAPRENEAGSSYKPFSNANQTQKTINFFNDRSYSCPANSDSELAGGRNREWKKITKIGYSVENKLPHVGDVMEALKEQLKHIKRIDVPLFLDPKTATFLDVAIHAKVRQFIGESTIEKHLRYARFMETHQMPIDFRNLTPEMFLRHMDYRLYYEDPPATPTALKHEKRALMMFLRAFKQYNEDWKKYIKTPPVIDNGDEIFVPSPSVINKLYHAKYSTDPYENVLFQTIVFTGVNFGMRPPSELCNLNLDDIVINSDGSGYIKYHEEKKHGKTRYFRPWNKSVLSSTVFRTPKNYIDTWRRKVVNEFSGDALFLEPNGQRITQGYIRKHIVPVFKEITGEKSAKLYTMRHTFGTYLYDLTKDIDTVGRKLGHKGLKNVDKYIHVAKDLREQSGKRNLFNQALRLIKARGKADKRDCCKKTHQSPQFPSRSRSGPAHIRYAQQEGINEIVCEKSNNLISSLDVVAQSILSSTKPYVWIVLAVYPNVVFSRQKYCAKYKPQIIS